MAVAIPFIMMAATAVSTVMAIKGARDAKKQRAKQASMEEANRLMQEKQTRAELAQADRSQRLRIGSIRAKGGARGSGVHGSVIDIIGDTIQQGFLERKNISEIGGMKAENFSRSADLFRMKGKSEYQSGMMNAATNLVGGGMQTYTAFQRVG